MQGLQQLKRIVSEQLLGGAGCDCQNWRSHIFGSHGPGYKFSGPNQKPVRVRFDGRAQGAFEAAVMGHMRPPLRKPKPVWPLIVRGFVVALAAVGLRWWFGPLGLFSRALMR